MTWRLALFALLLGASLVLVWLMRWWSRRRRRTQDALIDTLIAANRGTPRPGFDTFDDALRLRSQARRDQATRLHQRAAAVESGTAHGGRLFEAVRKTGSEG